MKRKWHESTKDIQRLCNQPPGKKKWLVKNTWKNRPNHLTGPRFVKSRGSDPWGLKNPRPQRWGRNSGWLGGLGGWNPFCLETGKIIWRLWSLWFWYVLMAWMLLIAFLKRFTTRDSCRHDPYGRYRSYQSILPGEELCKLQRWSGFLLVAQLFILEYAQHSSIVMNNRVLVWHDICVFVCASVCSYFLCSGFLAS